MRYAKLGVTVAAAMLIFDMRPLDAKELKFVMPVDSPRSWIALNANETFAQAIKQQTGGSITIKWFYVGQLLSPQNVTAGVRDGLAEGGWNAPAFIPSQLPHNTIVSDMVAFPRTPAAAAGAAAQTTLLDCPECDADYAKLNVYNFASYSGSFTYLMCNKPVADLSSIKGRSVRASSGGWFRWVKELGGVAIQMSPGDIANAMTLGQIDCAMASPDWLRSFGLKDVVTHIVDQNQGIFHGQGFPVNRAAWDGLTGKEKETLKRGFAQMWATATVGGFVLHGEENLNEAIKEKNVKLVKAGADFQNAWARFGESERLAVAEAARKRGVKNPERIIETHLRNIEKWEKLVADTGAARDAGKFADLLWREIYSKLKY
ncbi:MAG: hypothetical protein ACT4P3_02735 [Betaproteobacteria bacterium]